MIQFITLDAPLSGDAACLYSGSGLTILMSLRGAGTMGASYQTSHPNRLRFFKNHNVPADRVVGLKQIHSKRVWTAEEAKDPAARNALLSNSAGVSAFPPEGDGLVAAGEESVLSVTVADCLPVFLYHFSGSPYGVVHSGWKGTGIAAEAVRRMRTLYGAAPEELRAVVGPGIGPCCYAVNKERADFFKKSWGEETVSKRERWYIDLKKANCVILEESGVNDITVFDSCTCCHTGFGSYRREGSTGFTRMIALIGHLL